MREQDHVIIDLKLRGRAISGEWDYLNSDEIAVEHSHCSYLWKIEDGGLLWTIRGCPSHWMNATPAGFYDSVAPVNRRWREIMNLLVDAILEKELLS
jgi:hypothetical protein